MAEAGRERSRSPVMDVAGMDPARVPNTPVDAHDAHDAPPVTSGRIGVGTYGILIDDERRRGFVRLSVDPIIGPADLAEQRGDKGVTLQIIENGREWKAKADIVHSLCPGQGVKMTYDHIVSRARA